MSYQPAFSVKLEFFISRDVAECSASLFNQVALQISRYFFLTRVKPYLVFLLSWISSITTFLSLSLHSEIAGRFRAHDLNFWLISSKKAIAFSIITTLCIDVTSYITKPHSGAVYCVWIVNHGSGSLKGRCMSHLISSFGRVTPCYRVSKDKFRNLSRWLITHTFHPVVWNLLKPPWPQSQVGGSLCGTR